MRDTNKAVDLKPIPESIVKKTWHELAGFSPNRAKKEMVKLNNSQPDLPAFVTESSQKIVQEVRQLVANKVRSRMA